jgi:CAAX prenyl protease-like protein
VSEAMQKNQMLPRVVPFAIYILFLALSDVLAPIVTQLGMSPKWLYVLRIIAVIAALLYFLRNFIELNKCPPLQDFLYAAVSGLIVFVVWIFPYPTWLVAGADAVGVNPMQGLTDIESMLWLSTRIMGAALVVPIMEELFWRSYIMRRYDSQNFLSVNPETLSGFAYVGSACLFALEHNLWLAGLFAGLVYGELYKTYKNLWIPIFAHAVTNGVLGIWVVFTGNWQYW